MAETDILNPSDWAAAGLTFNPNPSYGFARKMGANRLTLRPRLGTFVTRDVMNGGHVFSLQWINTDLSTSERIVKFYHDFKAGYFTLIDTDWRARQYVGRFMNEPDPDHTANGKYSIQGVTFEEVPRARMLTYPSDFAHYGHTINVLDDDLNPRVAYMQGSWVTQVSPLAPSGYSATDPRVYEGFDAAGTVGDWAQMAYVGWGFQMTFRTGSSLGLVNIVLDGAQIVTGLDLSSGAVASGVAPANVTVATVAGVTSVTVSATSVPLDMHRVKVVAAGAGASSGTSILFPQLQYIY